MNIASTIDPAIGATSRVTADQGIGSLGGDDFLRLLIAELTNQDPLEPTSNQELLQQISSIRDIEMSTTLTRSLESLVDQQRAGSAASMIGKFAQGAIGQNGYANQGTVIGVHFGEDGLPVLRLDSGESLALKDVMELTTTERAARALIGKLIVAVLDGGSDDEQLVQGVVTGIGSSEDGEPYLELDNGQQVPLSAVVQVGLISSDDRKSS